MPGWLPTSDPSGAEDAVSSLCRSLQHQPLLLVLRHSEPMALEPLLGSLQAMGCLHVEVAWSHGPGWVRQMRGLIRAFPAIRLGAASLRDRQALHDAIESGCAYAVSPVLDGAMVEAAAGAGIVLVPGVMSPTEVARAMALGCRIVKLFPAAVLGPGYWRSLQAPLSPTPDHPWPFCIAAGGLAPHDVLPWLAAGVDAVALGSSLMRHGHDSSGTVLSQAPVGAAGPLPQLLAQLADRH